MIRRALGNTRNIYSLKSRIDFQKHGIYQSANIKNLNRLILGRQNMGNWLRRNSSSSTASNGSTPTEASKPEGSNDISIVLFALGIGAIVLGCVVFLPGETEDVLITDQTQCASKVAADKEPGTIPGCDNIKRVQVTTRIPIQNLTSQGIAHAGLEGTLWDCDGKQKCWLRQNYWNDEAVYELSLEAAEELRNATEQLHVMCLEAVDAVVNSEDLMTLFEIPENMRNEVRHSWHNRERDLLGRFDFMWDGRGPPKMAEYNADTPTILVETAVGQALWYDHVIGNADVNTLWVFNEIEKHLVSSWKAMIPAGSNVHFAGVLSSVEEREHIQYLRNTARRAGLFPIVADISFLEEKNGKLLAIDAIAGAAREVKYLFKLYPWEWLSHEQLATGILKNDKKARIIEPAWKLILGNKAILALLWHLFPNHPNLLPAYFDGNIDLMSGKDFVAKPKFGREGQGIVYSRNCSSLDEFISLAERNLYISTKEDGNYSPTDSNEEDAIYLGHPVYQQHCDTARFSGRHVVIGSWVVGGVPAGFNFREDSTDTTQDHSSFVPHLIKGKHSKTFSNLKGINWTEEQRTLYRELYHVDIVPVNKDHEYGGPETIYLPQINLSWWDFLFGGGNNNNNNKNNNRPSSSSGASSTSSSGGGAGSANNNKGTRSGASSPHAPNFKNSADKMRTRSGPSSMGTSGFKRTGSSHSVASHGGMGGRG